MHRGGHVIVFRLGAIYPAQADTDPFNLAHVGKQRHLNDAGRAKAEEIGGANRKLETARHMTCGTPQLG